MCELTVEQLLIHANELCQHHWGIDYTGSIELISRRWKNVNGRYLGFLSKGLENIPEYNFITMSKKRNAERTESEVLGTLLHELVHWRLHTTGIPHRDTNSEFIAECLRVGAPISEATTAQRAYKQFMKSYT